MTLFTLGPQASQGSSPLVQSWQMWPGWRQSSPFVGMIEAQRGHACASKEEQYENAHYGADLLILFTNSSVPCCVSGAWHLIHTQYLFVKQMSWWAEGELGFQVKVLRWEHTVATQRSCAQQCTGKGIAPTWALLVIFIYLKKTKHEIKTYQDFISLSMMWADSFLNWMVVFENWKNFTFHFFVQFIMMYFFKVFKYILLITLLQYSQFFLLCLPQPGTPIPSSNLSH